MKLRKWAGCPCTSSSLTSKKGNECQKLAPEFPRPRAYYTESKEIFYFLFTLTDTLNGHGFCLWAMLMKELCLAKWTSCPEADRCREQGSSGSSRGGWRTWYTSHGAPSAEVSNCIYHQRLDQHCLPGQDTATRQCREPCIFLPSPPSLPKRAVSVGVIFSCIGVWVFQRRRETSGKKPGGAF